MISDGDRRVKADVWKSDQFRFYLILGILLCLNMWQGYAMGLCHDEAYYWTYSRFLDWGYYDHPPLVAANVAFGYWLLSNELGVRLLFILMQILAITLVWKMSNQRDALLFWVLILSFPLLQVGGMLALPDMPLVFFSTLFLVAVRRYLKKDDWVSTTAIAASMTLMLYSKYHGVLTVLFTLLAVPALLRRKSFWVAVAAAVVMLTPHVIWQLDHDLVSLRFQLARQPDWLNGKLILEYIVGQIGSAGVLSGAILLYVLLFASKSADAFERVLKFNCIGIFAFFLIMSFKGKVEANWTQVAFIPLALICHKHIQRMRCLRKWTMWLALIPIVGVLAVKAIFLFPPEDSHHLRRAYEFSDWPQITEKIEEFAGGLPIVAGTYPHAASLWFYSGEIVPALNLRSRGNQFSLWQLERDLLEEEVCFVSNFEIPEATVIRLRQGDQVYLINGVTVAEIIESWGHNTQSQPRN